MKIQVSLSDTQYLQMQAKAVVDTEQSRIFKQTNLCLELLFSCILYLLIKIYKNI